MFVLRGLNPCKKGKTYNKNQDMDRTVAWKSRSEQNWTNQWISTPNIVFVMYYTEMFHKVKKTHNRIYSISKNHTSFFWEPFLRVCSTYCSASSSAPAVGPSWCESHTLDLNIKTLNTQTGSEVLCFTKGHSHRFLPLWRSAWQWEGKGWTQQAATLWPPAEYIPGQI